MLDLIGFILSIVHITLIAAAVMSLAAMKAPIGRLTVAIRLAVAASSAVLARFFVDIADVASDGPVWVFMGLVSLVGTLAFVFGLSRLRDRRSDEMFREAERMVRGER